MSLSTFFLPEDHRRLSGNTAASGTTPRVASLLYFSMNDYGKPSVRRYCSCAAKHDFSHSCKAGKQSQLYEKTERME
jgi:hypothetical protein